MKALCVFLVGKSLIADSMANLLLESKLIARLERFPTILIANDWIHIQNPDLLFIVDIEDRYILGNTPFMPICADIPVLCLDMHDSTLKLTKTNQVKANSVEMLAVVQSLVESI